MEKEPLLNKSVVDKAPCEDEDFKERQGVEKSNIKNLLFCNFVLFLLTLSSQLFSPVMSQYLYKRVSEDVFGNNSVIQTSDINQTCFLNTSDPNYLLQEKAQEIASAKQMQYTIMTSALGIVANIMLGSFSDSVGRRISFAIPMTGHFLRYGISTAIIYWKLDLNFFFLSEGMDGLLGSYYAILLATYSYTADNTPATGSRTMGIAIVDFCESIGKAAISTATGYFIEDTGFVYPSLAASLITLLAIILVVLFLPEKQGSRKKEKICITPLEGLRRVFGFYILDGSRRKRVCFCLAMLFFITTALPGVGGGNIDTLFQLNLPFCWSPEMIGYYGSVGTLSSRIIGIPLLKLLQCCCLDEVIGMIGSIAIAGADVLQGFASSNIMMYIVLAVKIPSSSIFPVARSILSILAPDNRQGSLFASIAVIETTCTLAGTPIFSNIYQQTVVWWRGFVFLIMGASHVLAAIVILIYIFVSKPEREKRLAATLIISNNTIETKEEKEDKVEEEDKAEVPGCSEIERRENSIQQGL